MADKKFTIEHDTIWQRPDQAYADFQEAAKGLSPAELADGKNKLLQEKRDIAIFGACIYDLTGQPTFVQMNDKSASPDAFLLQQSAIDETANDIAPVEITFYGGNKVGIPDESLADRLAKEGGKFREKLPPRYWLLVHIGAGLGVDHLEVARRLQEINAEFGVFSIQEMPKNALGDTMLRFVKYNPECVAKDINIGEVFHGFSGSDIPGEVTQVRGFPPKEATQ